MMSVILLRILFPLCGPKAFLLLLCIHAFQEKYNAGHMCDFFLVVTLKSRDR